MIRVASMVAHKNHPHKYMGRVLRIKKSGMWNGGKISGKDPIVTVKVESNWQSVQFRMSELVEFKGTIK